MYPTWVFCSFSRVPHKLLGIGALRICVYRAVHLARNVQKFFQLLLPKLPGSQVSRKVR